MTPIDELLERLESVKESGTGYAAFCPSHGDTKSRHLTVTEAEDGRVLLHCHHGCTFGEIMASLEMDPKQAFPRPVREGELINFHLRDSSGNKVATHHRRQEPNGSKSVWWSTEAGTGLGGMAGGSLPLWGAEGVSAVPTDEYIVLTEGEKAAFYLTNRGIPAVGTVTGASGTPGDDVLEVLRGRKVVLWPDNDEEGRKHMKRIEPFLVEIATEARVFTWRAAPPKGDAADHPAVRRGDDEALAQLRLDLSLAPLSRLRRNRDRIDQYEFLRPEYLKWLGNVEESGIGTGLPELDKNILGLSPGRSYVIAGAPGDGKSLLCGQLALTAAWQKKRVALFSIESSAMEYCQRLTCYMAGVDYFRAISQNMNDEERNRLFEAFEELCELPFLISDLGTQKPSFIRSQVEKHQPDLVVVDYLQYVTPDVQTGNRVEDLDTISREITALKGDYDIPILLAEQINRDSRSLNKEPELHNLRGSGGLEQDADVVMFLHRTTDGDGNLSEQTRLLGKKNRIAKRFVMKLEFVPGQQWFRDASDRRKGVVSYG